MEAAFDHFGKKNAGLEVRGDAECFKARREGAMCTAAVKSRDHTDWELGLRGGIRAEVVHDAFEIAGGDGDIGVVDEQIGMARVRGELDKIANLSIGSETGGAVDEADGVLGKLQLELFDGGNGGVV